MKRQPPEITEADKLRLKAAIDASSVFFVATACGITSESLLRVTAGENVRAGTKAFVRLALDAGAVEAAIERRAGDRALAKAS